MTTKPVCSCSSSLMVSMGPVDVPDHGVMVSVRPGMVHQAHGNMAELSRHPSGPHCDP